MTVGVRLGPEARTQGTKLVGEIVRELCGQVVHEWGEGQSYYF